MRNFIVLLFIFTFFQCKNTDSELLSIPTLEFMDNKYYIFDEQYLQERNEYSIIINIDGTCHFCLNDIKNIDMFFRKVKVSNTGIYYVIHFENDTNLLKYFLKDVKISYPIVIDYFNDFYFINKKTIKNDYAIYFVSNEKMEIIFSGHPVHSNKDSITLIKKLNKLGLVN